MRAIALLLSVLSICGCTTMPSTQIDEFTVTVRDLRNDPERWDGQRVQITSWITSGFENFNLYASREAICGTNEDRGVVGADTARIIAYGTMRRGIFKGTFRNTYGALQANGDIIVSTGHASPGPLEQIKVLRWLSPAEPICQ